VMRKQHRKISVPALRARFPVGTKVYIDQIALRQKGLQECEFRREVKAFLIPKWTAAIYTVAEVNGQTGRVVLVEFPNYSFYPYQLKPAVENLIKHGTPGTCDWQRPRPPRSPNSPQNGNWNVNHPPPVQPQGNRNNRRPIIQHFTRSQRGTAGNPFDSNRSESQLYRIAADVGRRNAGSEVDNMILKFLNEQSLLWKMPVEFTLKPRDTPLGIVEEFQSDQELSSRIRQLRNAFQNMFEESIYHENFKHYVEYIVVVLKRIDRVYDELVEKAVHAKLRLNGAE